MTCLDCQHWQLKAAGQMARHGLAACANGPRYTYLPDRHTCTLHKPASAEITEARVKWLKKQEG